jgi:CRISPR-associated protein Csx10
MSTQLIFKLELSSDYHVGTGIPLGSEVDSALLRDDKVPVLRGTTLMGLLRDSLWRLLQLQHASFANYRLCQRSGKHDRPRYCGEKGQPEKYCPICYLLGTPHLPKRWRVSSARPIGLDAPTASEGWSESKVDSQPIYRVRVNPRTRRAANNQLFSQENGDSRLQFLFNLDFVGYGQPSLDEIALLVAAIRNIRELGRSRRRGQGTCQITLEPITQQTDYLNHFEQTWLNDTVSLTLPKSNIPTVSTFSQPDDYAHFKSNPVRVRLLIRTDEPLVLARRNETGSLFETQHFIPGTRLRGAFASQFVNQNGLTDPETYAQFVRFFFRNTVEFANLYPALRKDVYLYSAIPAPKDFLTCKIYSGFGKGRHRAKGFAGQPVNIPTYCWHDDCNGKQIALQTLSDFVAIEEDSLREHTVSSRSEMHQQIDQLTQRVDEDNLFGYTVLKTGQYFVGELQFDDEETWSSFQKLTAIPPETNKSFTLHLGKALRRGYGQVTACWQLCDDQEPHILNRLFLSQRVNNPQQILTMTLLTDAIIVDEWGRHLNSFECAWLQQELGLQIQPKSLNVFAQTRQVDGFNTYLGVSRSRDIALVAGSAVGFKLLNPPDDWLSHLEKIEQHGIGLRRREGFGRVVFNHPIYAEESLHKAVAEPLRLPSELRLVSKFTASERILSHQERFINTWQRQLDDNKHWQPCRHEQFLGVARWLHANADKPLPELRRRLVDPQQIKEKSLEEINSEFRLDLSPEIYHHLRQLSGSEIAVELEHLGLPDKALVEVITESEYGTRYKASPIKQEGLNFICSMLNKLESETDGNQAYQEIGLKMLADRIAAEAQLSRKEDNA